MTVAGCTLHDNSIGATGLGLAQPNLEEVAHMRAVRRPVEVPVGRRRNLCVRKAYGRLAYARRTVRAEADEPQPQAIMARREKGRQQ